MRIFRILLLLVLAAFPLAAYAVTPDEMLRDPQQEARARSLSAQLRCMVCQNESIDESEATLARDIRRLVRDKISAGESDEAIKAFLVQRYGDFILLKPPFKPETLLLWGTPILVLFAAGSLIFFATRRRQESPPPLTQAEADRLAALVGKDEG